MRIHVLSVIYGWSATGNGVPFLNEMRDIDIVVIEHSFYSKHNWSNKMYIYVYNSKIHILGLLLWITNLNSLGDSLTDSLWEMKKILREFFGSQNTPHGHDVFIKICYNSVYFLLKNWKLNYLAEGLLRIRKRRKYKFVNFSCVLLIFSLKYNG